MSKILSQHWRRRDRINIPVQIATELKPLSSLPVTVKNLCPGCLPPLFFLGGGMEQETRKEEVEGREVFLPLDFQLGNHL